MLVFLRKYLSGKARSMGFILRLVRELSEVGLCKFVILWYSNLLPDRWLGLTRTILGVVCFSGVWVRVQPGLLNTWVGPADMRAGQFALWSGFADGASSIASAFPQQEGLQGNELFRSKHSGLATIPSIILSQGEEIRGSTWQIWST